MEGIQSAQYFFTDIGINCKHSYVFAEREKKELNNLQVLFCNFDTGIDNHVQSSTGDRKRKESSAHYQIR